MNPVQSTETGSQPAIPCPSGVSPSAVPAGLDSDPLVQSAGNYKGPERRSRSRIPRSLEISVQPLDDQMIESGDPFFAITRDISQGGLAYLSSHAATFSRAIVSLNDGIAPGIVCRICNSSVIHSGGTENICLTNVEFLFVHRPQKPTPGP